jgi:hypothetical protein
MQCSIHWPCHVIVVCGFLICPRYLPLQGKQNNACLGFSIKSMVFRIQSTKWRIGMKHCVDMQILVKRRFMNKKIGLFVYISLLTIFIIEYARCYNMCEMGPILSYVVYDIYIYIYIYIYISINMQCFWNILSKLKK